MAAPTLQYGVQRLKKDPFTSSETFHLGTTVPSYRLVHKNAGFQPKRRPRVRNHHRRCFSPTTPTQQQSPAFPRKHSCNNATARGQGIIEPLPLQTSLAAPAFTPDTTIITTATTTIDHITRRASVAQYSGTEAAGRRGGGGGAGPPSRNGQHHEIKMVRLSEKENEKRLALEANGAGMHLHHTMRDTEPSRPESAKQRRPAAWTEREAGAQDLPGRRGLEGTWAQRKGQQQHQSLGTAEEAAEDEAPCYCLLKEKLELDRLAGW